VTCLRLRSFLPDQCFLPRTSSSRDFDFPRSFRAPSRSLFCPVVFSLDPPNTVSPSPLTFVPFDFPPTFLREKHPHTRFSVSFFVKKRPSSSLPSPRTFLLLLSLFFLLSVVFFYSALLYVKKLLSVFYQPEYLLHGPMKAPPYCGVVLVNFFSP